MMGERDVSSALENGNHFQQKSSSIVLEFGDLTVEENRIAYIKAMILDGVIPSFDGEAKRLESTIFNLPRSTMDKVIATRTKLYEAHRKRSSILLKRFQRRYVSQSILKILDPSF